MLPASIKDPTQTGCGLMTGAEGAALCPGLVSSGAASIVSQPSRAQTLESLGRGVNGTPTLTLHGPAFVASASLFGEAGLGEAVSTPRPPTPDPLSRSRGRSGGQLCWVAWPWASRGRAASYEGECGRGSEPPGPCPLYHSPFIPEKGS